MLVVLVVPVKMPLSSEPTTEHLSCAWKHSWSSGEYSGGFRVKPALSAVGGFLGLAQLPSAALSHQLMPAALSPADVRSPITS